MVVDAKRGTALKLCSFVAVYALAAAAGLALSRGEAGVATIWPSNALLLAALLAFDARLRPAFAGLAWGAALCANLAFGNPLWVSGAFATINLLEPMLLLWALRDDQRRLTFDKPREVVRYGALAVTVSLAAAMCAALALAGPGPAFAQVTLAWFGGDALAYLVVTPIALMAIQLVRGDPAARPHQSGREVLVHVAAVASVAALVFTQSDFPLLFLSFAAIVVATYRLGPFGAALSTLIVALVGIACTGMDLGPVANIRSGHDTHLLFIQFYIAVLFATAFPLAALLADRRELLAAARASEAQFRRVVDQSGEIIFETDLHGRWRLLNSAWERVTGLNVADSLGRPYVSFVHPEDRATVLARFQRLGSRDLEEVECHCRWTLGDQVRWMSARARLLRDERGEVTGTCGTLHDITERREVELREADAMERVRQSHELLSLAGAVADVGHWRLDLETGLVEVSEEASRLLLIPTGSFPMPAEPELSYLAEDRPQVRAALEEGRAGNPFEFEARLALPDGSVRHIVTKGIAEPDWDGGVGALFAVVQDITARRAAEQALAEQEAHYRRLTQNATDIVLQLDLDGKCRFISPSVTEISGHAPEELLGQDLAIIIHPEDQPATRAAFIQVLRGDVERVTTSYRSPHKDGRWLWLESNLRAERDPATGRIIGLTGSTRDVGDRKALEFELIAARDRAEHDADKMYKLATTDELTGLANRRHFLARFDEELKRRRRKREPMSVAIFDIDFFKRINDTHGHDGGDELLRAVARVAAGAVRAGDLVGRLGGEEFGVLLPACTGASAEEVCERLRQAVAANIVKLTGGTACRATISIGMAEIGMDEPADQAIRRADQALYAAKHAGRDCLRLAA